jgi:hypothetical protein
VPDYQKAQTQARLGTQLPVFLVSAHHGGPRNFPKQYVGMGRKVARNPTSDSGPGVEKRRNPVGRKRRGLRPRVCKASRHPAPTDRLVKSKGVG